MLVGVKLYGKKVSDVFSLRIEKHGKKTNLPSRKEKNNPIKNNQNKNNIELIIMKLLNYISGGVLAMFTIVLFSQCAGNNNNQTTASTVQNGEVSATTDLKIAYVEIDSLLMKYDYWNDLNELMMKKEENIRATLNKRMRELENDAKEFQNKLENNGFASRERAEQENNRLVKKQQDLQELQTKLMGELESEQKKNNLQLRDSINSFLKIYNKDKGYSFIISNTMFDNLLYADETYNITKEIVDGLNRRYSPSIPAK